MIDKKTASFMRSLSLGNLEEEILIPFPEPRVAEKETLGAIRQTLASMLGGRDAEFRAWDRAGEMPASFVRELKEAGLFSLVVPEPYGGMGLGATAYSRALQEVGRYDASMRGHGGRTQLDRHARAPALRHRRAEGALPARTRHRRAGRRVLPDRAGLRLRRGSHQDHAPCATATTGCSTARSSGSPTAASPTSSPSSPRPRCERAAATSPPSSSPAT